MQGLSNIHDTPPQQYDLTITTQEEFDTMLASPTWLDATSVALMADALTVTNTETGTIIPTNVRRIDGFGTELIAYSNIWPVRCYAILSYNADLDESYSINDLNITITGINTFAAEPYAASYNEVIAGFYKCRNLRNCKVTISDGGSYNYIQAFCSCNHLTNCSVLCNNASIKDGDRETRCFNTCKFLTNCYGYNTDGSYAAIATNYTKIFYDCDHLSMCIAETGRCRNVSGFEECYNLNDCEFKSSSQCELTSFSKCNNMVNCYSGISVGTNVEGYVNIKSFNSCNYLDNCTDFNELYGWGVMPMAEGLSFDYNKRSFYGCSYLSGCYSLDGYSGQQAAFIFENCSNMNNCCGRMTGTNTKIDTTTCDVST